jgi:FemAB family protein
MVPNFEIEQLDELIALSGMSVKYRSEAKKDWNDAHNLSKYSPVAYGYSVIDYEWQYQCDQGGEWKDFSLIIFWGNKLAGLWPLSFSVKDGQGMLSSHGLPVLPPLFVEDCPAKSRKRIVKSCMDLADSIAKTTHLESWESGESFVDSLGMSEWHVESMSRFAECCVKHELFLDIRPEMDEIKRNFRKSYKPLISSGMRTWEVETMRESNPTLWDEYRELHFQVAGRMTRSADSWELQHQEIANGHAFLVFLRNDTGDLVGGGFFKVSRDEGFYNVGTYNRDLFDKPLGHVVQYRAIEEMKRRGVRWYKIGSRPFPCERPEVTQKEFSIGEFKQGFASHTFPKYLLHHRVNRND